MEYEIKSYTKFSWGYVYHLDGKDYEIWADSVESLKRKVLAKHLPWDDGKVPKAKTINVNFNNVTYIDSEGSPAQFRLPWCKSNYKRY